MSISQVLATVRAALEDPDTGLAARTRTLADADSSAAGLVRSDFRFVQWEFAEELQPTASPVVFVAPERWTGGTMDGGRPVRPGVADLVVGYGMVGGDMDTITLNASTVAAALVQVLDGLPDYAGSDPTAPLGSIARVVEDEELDNAYSITFGAYPGSDARVPTARGFRCSFTVEERSTQ